MANRNRSSNLLWPFFILAIAVAGFNTGCARTEIVESPRTAFVPETAEIKEPQVIWTSRAFSQPFDYLGQIKVRSWTYDGAVGRMVDAAKQLRADAIIDVHYDKVGFLNTLQAFAIKYK